MDKEIKDLLSQMSLEEKCTLLSGANMWETKAMPERGIPSIFLADGPVGLRKQDVKAADHLGIFDSVPATACVSGPLLASTWNKELMAEQGRVLGEEASANGVDILLGPALNLVRSPLCGRNFEYFSEDPYLTGKTASAYVTGVQSCGVGACLKHFAVNNQETEREYIDAIIDERTLRELYLTGFEIAIKEARPVSVMTALNQINGEYGAENTHLLTEILREDWGFQGIAMCDWFGVVHPEKAVCAGLDLMMPGSGSVNARKLECAFNEGRISMEELDACCGRLIKCVRDCRAQKNTRSHRRFDEKMKQSHHESMRRIAEEGIILLKNQDEILPLKKNCNIAVIGLYAVEPRIALQGSARVICTKTDTPLSYIQKNCSETVAYAQGYGAVENCRNQNLAAEAVAIAGKSDTVLLFLGLPERWEAEGHDRKNMELPEEQNLLLEKICQANKNVIVILANGSAVEMPWHDRVKAIVECFYGGQAMGSALSDILFGKVNPSGKLPITFPARLQDTPSYFFFPGDKETVRYAEGIFAGYRYYERKGISPLFPFGHGLSYTQFHYSNMRLDKSKIFDDETVTASVEITNTGKIAGSEAVQLYIGMFDELVMRPNKELKGFEKVFLKPGESRTVTFFLDKRSFAFYRTKSHEWYVSPGVYKIMAGSSSQDIRETQELEVIPRKVHRKPLSGWSKVGELRETPRGEEVYQIFKAMVLKYVPEEGAFFNRSMCDTDEKLESMYLRRIILATDGIINNDDMLEYIKQVNEER